MTPELGYAWHTHSSATPGIVKIPVMFAGLMVQAEGLGEIERERGWGLSYRVRKPGGFTVVDKLIPVIDDQVGRAQAINRNTCTGSGETVENRWLSVGPAVWSPVHGLWISWSFINSTSIVMTFGNPQM
ncbi:hypothetical protein NEUTE1DRAFT_98195 [Neurospora tetrasperma FGSC 2508]|uniref:Uncharacterized protein n=1 Tax=Neurospora tetrasperma (strain FGSC 2508 / ATCC MYA-4615 / P0657) TaxID=510951 RepID=F8MB27_NEUT8|nr:uncharacterized protein NEUTE1DRAFT_98195 [Neurospora tetrasperma FGSC 2508]EGO61046.1 hypothetical protein NEUTE1DRAFT_98195 [Neurospora tetrasperma FGSC 2508]